MVRTLACLLIALSNVCLGMTPVVRHMAYKMIHIYKKVPKPLVPSYLKIVGPHLHHLYLFYCTDGKRLYSRETEDIHGPIATYIRSELSKHGVKNTDTIDIKVHPQLTSTGVCFDRLFFLGSEERQMLEWCINSQSTINPHCADNSTLIQAIIAHEAHHIKEFHGHKKVIEPTLAVFLTTLGYGAIIQRLSKRCAYKINSSWSLGIAVYATITILSKMRTRSFERSADEAIPDDHSLLEATQAALERTHSDRTWLEALLESHPTPEERVARFKERIHALADQKRG